MSDKKECSVELTCEGGIWECKLQDLRAQLTAAEQLIDRAYHHLVPEHINGSVEWFKDVRRYLERYSEK